MSKVAAGEMLSSYLRWRRHAVTSSRAALVNADRLTCGIRRSARAGGAGLGYPRMLRTGNTRGGNLARSCRNRRGLSSYAPWRVFVHSRRRTDRPSRPPRLQMGDRSTIRFSHRSDSSHLRLSTKSAAARTNPVPFAGREYMAFSSLLQTRGGSGPGAVVICRPPAAWDHLELRQQDGTACPPVMGPPGDFL